MKIIIYTAIYWNYDELLPIVPQDMECEFILFTDRPRYTKDRRVVIKDFQWIPNHLKSRYMKTHSHSLAWTNDWISIWIDGNVIIKRPDFVRTLVEAYKWWILCIKNDERDSIIEEMDNLKTRDRFKDQWDKIEEQRQFYIEDWYKFDNGFSWNSILVRDNSPDIAKFNELWWNQIIEYCYRDMLSMEYCAWKTWVSIHHLPREGRNNEYMEIWYHSVLSANK